MGQTDISDDAPLANALERWREPGDAAWFDKAASQTRDYCVAKNATLRAARPDCFRIRSGQVLIAQGTLVRNKNRNVELAN